MRPRLAVSFRPTFGSGRLFASSVCPAPSGLRPRPAERSSGRLLPAARAARIHAHPSAGTPAPPQPHFDELRTARAAVRRGSLSLRRDSTVRAASLSLVPTSFGLLAPLSAAGFCLAPAGLGPFAPPPLPCSDEPRIARAAGSHCLPPLVCPRLFPPPAMATPNNYYTRKFRFCFIPPPFFSSIALFTPPGIPFPPCESPFPSAYPPRGERNFRPRGKEELPPWGKEEFPPPRERGTSVLWEKGTSVLRGEELPPWRRNFRPVGKRNFRPGGRGPPCAKNGKPAGGFVGGF